MKIITSDSDTCLIIPKKICIDDKIEMMKEIKHILLTYNKIYHFLSSGFYKVEVRFHKIIGTIFTISLLDDLSFIDNNVDLKIILIGETKVGLEFDDLIEPVDQLYYYKDHLYLVDFTNLSLFLTLLEHGTFILEDKVEEVLKNGKKISDIEVSKKFN